MKVACLQDQLQRALGQVSRAVATKTALPVLSNVLLSAQDDWLEISGTNLEIGITTSIDASVEEPGKITVDARLLSEFVNTLPAETVRLTSDSVRWQLTVQSGRDKATINGIDPDDFPVIPKIGEDSFSAEIDPQLLRDMISQVEFAAASDDSRPVLAAVLTRFEGEKLTLAAADGFRLAVREETIGDRVSSRFDILVPARAYRELARIIGDAAEPIRISVTPNHTQLLVNVGGTSFLSRLIEGTFPDFRQIIPREVSTKVEIGRDVFMNAVKRASYFARDNNDVVRLNVQPSEDDMAPGTLEIAATAAERGNSQSYVDATIHGPELQIAFNARYLSDILGSVRQASVQLGMNGGTQAGIVRPAGLEDKCTHVIMPMVIGAS